MSAEASLLARIFSFKTSASRRAAAMRSCISPWGWAIVYESSLMRYDSSEQKIPRVGRDMSSTCEKKFCPPAMLAKQGRISGKACEEALKTAAKECDEDGDVLA